MLRSVNPLLPWQERKRCMLRWMLALVGLVLVGNLAHLGHYWVYGTPHLHDRVSSIDDKSRRIFETQAINNTVVVVPVNTGMIYWVENLLCSLRRTSFDSSRIVFWTLDSDAQAAFNQKGRATYLDPTLFSVTTNENIHGNTLAFKRLVRERAKFFVDLLSTGLDVLLLDADTVFYQSPLRMLVHDDNGNADADVDIIYSTDAREFYQTHDAFKDARRRGSLIPPICTGIFWMKSSAKTIALWQDMLDVFEGGWRIPWWRRLMFPDDQRSMDMLLNDGRARLVEPFPAGITSEMVRDRYTERSTLTVQLLDQTEVVNGHLFMNRNSTYSDNLARLRKADKDRIAVHLNWDAEEVPKERGAQENDLFFLDNRGACTL